ncbi:hypothetical protein [Arenimonas composti]|uniref:Uncharacterized protein n=1 Tax=Arenimonas composti TR7-09 = DSM 18010 TaxID=1121013 RepID=A0A091BE17_9GAMM|nr:hypothetical protein [Arenimonas composti]KFN49787.1 hypothetical protein P873_09535 [Arenimonas composti TR7-09 = DSM 18010]
MTLFHSDAEFVASLKPAQRDYYLGRAAEIQQQLQDALREISRGLSAVSLLTQDFLALQSQDPEAPRRVLRAGDKEYRYATVPGSGRIRLLTGQGTEIGMWDPDRTDPWAIRYPAFTSFANSGNAAAIESQLRAVDRRRRSA